MSNVWTKPQAVLLKFNGQAEQINLNSDKLQKETSGKCPSHIKKFMNNDDAEKLFIAKSTHSNFGVCFFGSYESSSGQPSSHIFPICDDKIIYGDVLVCKMSFDEKRIANLSITDYNTLMEDWFGISDIDNIEYHSSSDDEEDGEPEDPTNWNNEN